MTSSTHPAAEKVATTVLHVGGLGWASEKAVVEQVLGRRPGVRLVEANPVAQTATVTFDIGQTSVAELRRWVRECGFHCVGQSVPSHVCDPMAEPDPHEVPAALARSLVCWIQETQAHHEPSRSWRSQHSRWPMGPLADLGLRAALEVQARKAALPVTIEAADLVRYPQQIEAAVYFCVLEALQNTAKYAQASTAQVTLCGDGQYLVFTVTDDGKGFDPATTPKGTGLQGMTDRLGALGGTIDITYTPGHGTRLTGRVPTAA
jgi:copper chaperone CopZ